MRLAVEEADCSDLEGNSDMRATAVMRAGREFLDGRVVVSLWIIQVVTVPFTVVLTVWMTLANDNENLPDSQAWARVAATIVLSPLVLILLLVEGRLFMRKLLSATTYLRIQIIKTAAWSLLLYIILATVSGVGAEGIGIFSGAAKKLLLPFLASMAYSIAIWRHERVVLRARRVENAVAIRPIEQNIHNESPS